MTLLQQSATLREKLTQVDSLGANQQVIRSWQPLLQALPLHVARLERLVAVLRRLHGGNLLPAGRSLAPNGLDALLKELPELRDKLVNKPDKVMQKSGWAKADASLKGAANTLEKSLDGIWKTHLQNLAPKLDDWLPFFQVDRFGEEVRRIKTLNEELQSLAQKLPDDDELLKRVEAKSSEIHRLIKKLDYGDIPPEVKKFMEQVANSGGVSLGEVNDKVLAWLREKNLLQAFRVSMGGR
jgi:hypothetical protein